MAIYYKTQGFIFKKKDIFEADRVFSVFTYDFGRLEIVGRAIRKITSKLRGGIEIFSLSEIEFIQGKNRKTLTDTIAIERFNNIIKDPNKLEISYKISEVLDNFIKGQEKDEDIFILLNETLGKLNNHKLQTPIIQLIYYYFLWNFLSVIGYHPEIQNCVICRLKLNPHSLYFSNKNGGVICKNCSGSDIEFKEINSDTVKILRLILKKDWKILSKLKVDIFSQNLFGEISDNYLKYNLTSPII
ncbi:MAG: DNA repair protein RecO [Candidatus Staskawiczbacteria bacterium]|nr:DNA repair protein RecO [Candidatus Staskawiczbacteria bacterium]